MRAGLAAAVALAAQALAPQTALAQAVTLPDTAYRAKCIACHEYPVRVLSTGASPLGYGKIIGNAKIDGTVAQMRTAMPAAYAYNLSPEAISDAEVAQVQSFLRMVRDLVVIPSVPAFPTTVAGTTSGAPGTITIANARAAAVPYSYSVTGANAGDFSVSASCTGGSVPADNTDTPCTLTVQFSPSAAGVSGTRSATLVLSFTGTSGDPTPPTRNIPLQGDAQVLAPQFSISPTGLTFSAVAGASTTGTATITNGGNANLVLGTLSFSGAQASDYSFGAGNQCVASGVLTPGSNCQLVVQFAPPAAGARNASLSITHNASGSPQVLTLAGTATPAPQPAIELSVASVAFGDTQLGSTAQRSFTVRNSGQAPLGFTSFTLGGAAAGDYTRGGTCTTGTPLAVGATCSVTLSFTPGALGSRSATLSIASNASNGTASVPLSGSGVPVPAPAVSLSAGSLDFGSQTVGGIYPARSVTLTNSGNQPLVLTSLAASGAGFALTTGSPCPATLAAGASCTVSVGFTPTAAGTDYAGAIDIVSNAPGSPHRVALAGRGTVDAVPALVWSPAVARMSFGDVSVGTVSAVQSATLTNQGPGGAVLHIANAVGVGASSYSVTLAGCTVGQVIFQGQSCQVNVQFTPDGAGEKTATVQVASSGSHPPTLTLQGTGLAAPGAGLAVSATAVSFSGTQQGSRSLPSELTLSSRGTGSLRVTGLEVQGPYNVQNKSCPTLPFTLPPGSECTLSITFEPTGTGAAGGVLSITSDASATPQQVTLSGEGTPAADTSGGGCSLVEGDTLVDPTLWALLLAAGGVLVWRRREGAADARASRHGGART
ncbi:choice-of-anchor D domain-containing protein [Caldimonas brevitalea]|nr:choice-of-anchor D domain-containing protein [Caldimonas brevitalea]